MKRIEIPIHAEKAELFAFLKKNQKALIQEKKLFGKECEGFAYIAALNSGAIKANAVSKAGGDVLNVKAVINTTNWLDTHLDVHMPGIWKKALDENKMLMHLQEHNMAFDHIIADGEDLKAYTKNYTWKELGFDYKGTTQALVFDSQVKKSRNAYMFDQYANGYVKNHSVYMVYVKMVLCINEPDSTDYGAEYEAWQKYLPDVVNKEFAMEMGYFWAQLEAKIIEGSAVPRGSNVVTPTLSAEPSKDTQGKNESREALRNIFKLNLSVPEKGFSGLEKLKL
jgi:hypothetical protein